MHTLAKNLPLLNAWQRDFPLCSHPFAVIGCALDRPVDDILATCLHLQQTGTLARIGGVFAPGAGGAGMLAAMAVPVGQLEAVATFVSSHPSVNHNYERDNPLNLWFVLGAADNAAMEAILADIERHTGLTVVRLPMERPYRIDLGFDLGRSTAAAGGKTTSAHTPVAHHESGLAALAEQGLPMVQQPFAAWAKQLGWTEPEVLSVLSRWLAQGTLSRFGMVVRHHEMGFTANAMTVFDVADEQVDVCGEMLAQQPGITLAYRRARSEHWPYNLYCMVHGRERGEVLALIEQAAVKSGMGDVERQVLFSLRRFTQRGPRRFAAAAAAAPFEDRHA